ncbi:MAG: arylsulfatase [Planctomycetota bacterium]|nr:arylsulfatase [Planctomycetota bacterium]
MKITRYLATTLLFVAIPAIVCAAGHPGKPNIVFVLFDDIGYGQPPVYRTDSEFKTPNIDRLAREGMRFTDAHSAAANCTPTRYGVLTGRYPSRIGQFGVLKTYSPPIIPKERLTVASFLQQHGYHTACIGKWHLGMNWVDGKPGTDKKLPIGAKATDGPGAVGFDYFYGFTHARNIGSVIEQDEVVANVEAVENQPLMISKAVEYIEQRSEEDRPFFLYFPMCPPHNPIAPAQEFVGKSGIEGKEGRYGDWIYQGDHMLGRILDALERTGLAKDTLVIATGDNGAAKRPYKPLREAKSSIYEGGHREPFVARWPGRTKPGAVSHQTICLNDLFATCADILKSKLPESAAEDSVSILPCLLGTATGTVREATIHQASGGLAIRQGPWKLVFHRSGNRELFNLESDISETQDVAAANDSVVKGLTGLMQSYIDRGRSTPGATQKNDFEMSVSFGRDRKKSSGKDGKKKKRNRRKERKEQ